MTLKLLINSKVMWRHNGVILFCFIYFFLSRAMALGRIELHPKLGSLVISYMILSKIVSFSEPWFT